MRTYACTMDRWWMREGLGDGNGEKWWKECIIFTEVRKSAFMVKLRKEENNIKEKVYKSRKEEYNIKEGRVYYQGRKSILSRKEEYSI